MTRTLHKAAKAHFAAVSTTVNSTRAEKDDASHHAYNIATSSLRAALRERGVKSELNSIWHKELQNVWLGVGQFPERLILFVNRLNELVNEHMPSGKKIKITDKQMKIDSEIGGIRSLLIDKILEQYVSEGT